MPRSPWRDAIDGKIEVLRGLRGQGTLLSLQVYFNQATSLEGLPRKERMQRATQMALQMRRLLQEQVTLAEPFAITNDIQEYIARQVNLAGAAGPQPILTSALARTYHRTDPPVPSGFVWLHEPVAVCVTPPNATEADVAAHVADPAREVIACVVRALLFTPSTYTRAPAGHPDAVVPDPTGRGHSLRIVAFIDGDDRHSVWGMGLHDRDPINDPIRVPFGMIPVVMPYVVEGEPLSLQMEALLARYADDPVDQITHAWPTMFLFILFELMRQKVLLWGGSGLERDARKAAERNGLTPIVQVVSWRKAEYRYPAGHVPGKIDWSCRWPVTEHVRRLKNPDGSIRKVITIPSYVKGPDGKPLKRPNQRVNLVKR